MRILEPWRLYLAPVPALALLLVPHKFGPLVSLCLWGALCFTLAPTIGTIKRWLWLLYIDGVAKYQWVKRQPLRAAMISGGVSGLVAGLAFSLIPTLGRVVYTRGWYEAYVPRMIWPVLGELSWLAIVFPLVPGFVALITARRFFNGNWALTDAFAALAFPIGSFPSLWWLHAGGPMIWTFFNVAFAVFALLGGYMAHRRERPVSVRHP